MNDFSWTTLTNGMRLGVLEQPDAPVVTMNLVFRAGCAYEQEDQQGYAHMLEHMLLKGTKARPSSMVIGKEIDRIGAYSDATTGLENLWFIMQGSRENLPLLLEVMRDNITDSLIDEATLENEKKVVLEEFVQREGNFQRSFLTKVFKHLFGSHPSGRDALGDKDAIRRASQDKLVAYWRRMLVPENATLLIIGGVAHATTRDLVERTFSPWKSEDIFTLPQLPEHSLASKGAEIALGSAVPHWMVAYPSLRLPTLQEYAALVLLRQRLSYGYSSLLKDELRTKRGIAYNIGILGEAFGGAYLLCIYSTSQKPSEAADVVQDVVRGALRDVTAADLSDLKAQYRGIVNRSSVDPFSVLSTMRELLRVFGGQPSLGQLYDAVENLDIETIARTHEAFFSGVTPRIFIGK